MRKEGEQPRGKMKRKGNTDSWSQWPQDPEERRRDLPGKATKVSGNRREAAVQIRYRT